MRTRLLICALAYSVFLLFLLLFPPFHDGLHHWYNWHPNGDQVFDLFPPLADTDSVRAHFYDLLFPDRLRLTFEALIGLVSSTLLFLTLELVALIRDYRSVPIGGNSIVEFLLYRS
jgi:hypothetical protein